MRHRFPDVDGCHDDWTLLSPDNDCSDCHGNGRQRGVAVGCGVCGRVRE